MWAQLLGKRSNFSGLNYTGMILPEPGHRSRVLVEPFLESERLSAGIHRQRGAARSVHTNADNLLWFEAPHMLFRVGQGVSNGNLRPFDVIPGVLPGQIGIASKDNACVSVLIRPNGRGHFLAIGGLDDQRTHRISSIIQTDSVLGTHRLNRPGGSLAACLPFVRKGSVRITLLMNQAALIPAPGNTRRW